MCFGVVIKDPVHVSLKSDRVPARAVDPLGEIDQPAYSRRTKTLPDNPSHRAGTRDLRMVLEARPLNPDRMRSAPRPRYYRGASCHARRLALPKRKPFQEEDAHGDR
jgi:hypothetical protein